jgi:phosphoribosylglycinamide formyltransferase-1
MISGRGSNLASLLEFREEVDIRLVVSSRADAFGLLRAKRAGVRTAVMPLLAQTRNIDWDTVISLLEASGATHVFLAGFMRLVPSKLIDRYSPGKIVNLHPSLLPAYPGLRSIERAYVDGHDLGCTVHEVIEKVDAGKLLCQRRSLRSSDFASCDLGAAEFLVHVDEQRVVREVLSRWRTPL